ncbi:hypothetical protein L3Q67_02175 [Saccharothrix sp. AJ9571]|nr:hypothetical protein L3Q67_02175 [Saccharothrix sp. AJ9571]
MDASDTIAVMVDGADNPWGRRLYDALSLATYADSAYVVGPYANVGLRDFRPDAPQWPDVADRTVSGVLGNLQAAGHLTARTVLHETSSEGYLSDGRAVTAVHVVRPFALVAVHYRFSREADSRAIRYGHAYADQWNITDRSYIVPTGWYLVGEVGDYRAELSGVAGMNADPDGFVFELEGFGASTCSAECGSCGARWSAESGSWHFRAEECDADGWNFDDADVDETTGTVSCPACSAGRVGFAIH